ncbi:phosphoglycerate dehydrogenase-like enzyme [Bradyrhizobium sp. USDA 4503]
MRKILVADATFQAFDHEKAVAARHGASFHFAQLKSDEQVATGLPDGAGIVRYSIGLDNADSNGAKKRGIPVAYLRDNATGEVADHTVGGLW